MTEEQKARVEATLATSTTRYRTISIPCSDVDSFYEYCEELGWRLIAAYNGFATLRRTT